MGMPSPVSKTADAGASAPSETPVPPAAPGAGTPAAAAAAAPREIGGRGGPDPTRYGDWEHNGRCIDF
jgi:hypothetical protein